MELKQPSCTYSPSYFSPPSNGGSILSSHSEKIFNTCISELRSSSGLISVKYAESLLRKAIIEAYNLAMNDLNPKRKTIHEKIQIAEADLNTLKAAKREAELTFKIAKSRIDEIDRRIRQAEDSLESLVQGQLELD